MQFFDSVSLNQTRKTSDGYLVADAKVARSGVYTYLGRDVGRPEVAEIKVYRPPEEVFNVDSMASVAHRPITFGHPQDLVDAKNWRKHTVGLIGGEVVRDGDFLRVPLTVMDQAAIDSVENHTKELSLGYKCDLEFVDGITEKGEAYNAIQRNIRVNHLAIVKTGRAGHECRIGDEDMATRTIVVDGISIETTDQGAQAVEKLQKQLTDAASIHATTTKELADAKSELGKKEGEVAVLTKKLEDAKVTPAMLDAAVAERTTLIEQAKKLAPKIVTDGKSSMDIKREAVAITIGDAEAKALSDDAISGAFAFACKNVKTDPYARVVGDGVKTPETLEDIHANRSRELRDAWKGKAA